MERISDYLKTWMSKMQEEGEKYIKRKEKIWELINNEKCNHCDNGIVYFEEDGLRYEWVCDDYLKLFTCDRRRGLLRSIFGEEFEEVTTEKLDKNVYQVYESYNFDRDVIIIGPLGTGKTSLLALFLIKAKILGKSCCIRNPNKFLKDYFTNKSNIFESFDILMIDDIGIEYSYDNFKSAFEEIIDYRWRNRKATIITSNYDVKTLFERYPRAMDRIQHKGILIYLKGKSLRGINENNK